MLAHWSLDVFYSLRSRRKHKAWGVSPRMGETMTAKPAKRATASSQIMFSYSLAPVARFTGSENLLSRLPGVPLRSTPGFMLPPANAGLCHGVALGASHACAVQKLAHYKKRR
jgi:hypothetical protein